MSCADLFLRLWAETVSPLQDSAEARAEPQPAMAAIWEAVGSLRTDYMAACTGPCALEVLEERLAESLPPVVDGMLTFEEARLTALDEDIKRGEAAVHQLNQTLASVRFELSQSQEEVVPSHPRCARLK